MHEEANQFFTDHPLKKEFFEFEEEIRHAAVSAALRDVTAALKLETFPDDPDPMLKAAVFEQAVYLLLNPHVLSGNTDSKGCSVLAPRALALLPETGGNTPECRFCSIVRG